MLGSAEWAKNEQRTIFLWREKTSKLLKCSTATKLCQKRQKPFTSEPWHAAHSFGVGR